jgi:AcrR family transcriptional regulator
VLDGPGSNTRTRILIESLRLFSVQGYKGTTIAEIEKAAGLSPGSGALYTHFRSKSEVLETVVDAAIERAGRAFELFDSILKGSIDEQLHLVARATFLLLDSSVDLVKLLFKEADTFPDLLARLRESAFDPGYVWMADWVRRTAPSADDVDAEAVAAVAIGSLMNYWLQTRLLGTPPMGLERERFVSTWVNGMHGLLGTTA